MKNTNVVSMSETYFEYADETVTAAEQYSEKIAARIRLTEIISALDILLLIFLIVQQQIQHIKAVRENYILSKKAYLDVHTGLPNKSRCEDLLNSSGFITEPLCFVMFDLNNLKEVNDTLGHAAGDSMIANFAHILRKVVPEKILSADTAVTNLSLFCMTPPPGRQTNYWKNYMLRSNSIIPAICRMRSVTPMVTATP